MHYIELQEKLINILKEKYILNEETTLIEIASGTGFYTVPFAKEVKKVLAIENSLEHLELLQENSWNNNLTKVIDIKHTDLIEFQSIEKYDITFIPNSMNLQSYKEFEKIIDFTKSYICIMNFIDERLKTLQEWFNLKDINYEEVSLNTHYSDLKFDQEAKLLLVKLS